MCSCSSPDLTYVGIKSENGDSIKLLVQNVGDEFQSILLFMQVKSHKMPMCPSFQLIKKNYKFLKNHCSMFMDKV